MTHSIRLNIITRSWGIVKEIEERVKVSNSLEQFHLVKKSYSYSNNGIHPFIYFPEKEDLSDEEPYIIQIETGSHCSIEDTEFALYVWTYWYLFLRDLDEQGILEKVKYNIWNENDNTIYKDIKEYWIALVNCDSDLEKVVK